MLAERIGYTFVDPELLARSMAHRSWCAEHPGTISNERLEFLGDAVLGWVVADLAFRRFLDLPEGALTGVRKGVVNALALADVAEELDLGSFLLLGAVRTPPAAARSRRSCPTRWRPCSARCTSTVVRRPPTTSIERLIGPRLAETAANLDHLDHKSRLQEQVAVDGGSPPEYVDARRGSRPRQAVLRRRRRRRRRDRAGHGAIEEGGRAGRGGRRLRPARRRPCLSSPRSRRSVAGSPSGSSAGPSSGSRSVASARCGGRRASRSIDGLTGTTILDADRRGKYLLLPLDTGDELMVHLRMSGQLLLAPAGAERAAAHPRRARACPASRAEELWFVDPRTFGEVVVFDPDHVDVELPELAKMGIDPLARRPRRRSRCRPILAGRRTRLKPLLLDQHVIAGIGNIYADEILHAAKLHPERIAGSAAAAGGRAVARRAARHPRRRRSAPAAPRSATPSTST